MVRVKDCVITQPVVYAITPNCTKLVFLVNHNTTVPPYELSFLPSAVHPSIRVSTKGKIRSLGVTKNKNFIIADVQ